MRRITWAYQFYWFFGGTLGWAVARRVTEWSQARRRVRRYERHT